MPPRATNADLPAMLADVERPGRLQRFDRGAQGAEATMRQHFWLVSAVTSMSPAASSAEARHSAETIEDSETVPGTMRG